MKRTVLSRERDIPDGKGIGRATKRVFTMKIHQPFTYSPNFGNWMANGQWEKEKFGEFWRRSGERGVKDSGTNCLVDSSDFDLTMRGYRE
jgi:hypothetical protein